MKCVLFFLLLGFCINLILANDDYQDIDALYEQIEKNPTKFYLDAASLFERIYNRSRLEATEPGNVTAEEFNKQSADIRAKLDNIYKVVGGLSVEDYLKIPSPLDVFGNNDNTKTTPKEIENFGDLLWGIKAEVDGVVKKVTERAIELEADINNRTYADVVQSLFFGIEFFYCNLTNVAPVLADCMCRTDLLEHNCYQLTMDAKKKLRSQIVAAVQNVIDEMYNFPGDLNTFSQKPEKDGKILYANFFVTRHMQALDRAYDKLKKQLKDSESELYENKILWNNCAREFGTFGGFAYFVLFAQNCMKRPVWEELQN